jgi:hypothetical protein
MGIAKKTDGRYVVGVGVDNANDYKGSAAYRDIYIQLTSSGATAKSEEYLTFLKDYGFHANASGEPIMPPSVNVWISNNGVTTAVEADDVSIDGNNYTICGIKWDGSAWDYTNAGQGSGGGSQGGAPTIVNITQTEENTYSADKTYQEIATAFDNGVVYFSFEGQIAIVAYAEINGVGTYYASWLLAVNMGGWKLMSLSVAVYENNVAGMMNMFTLTT